MILLLSGELSSHWLPHNSDPAVREAILYPHSGHQHAGKCTFVMVEGGERI